MNQQTEMDRLNRFQRRLHATLETVYASRRSPPPEYEGKITLYLPALGEDSRLELEIISPYFFGDKLMHSFLASTMAELLDKVEDWMRKQQLAIFGCPDIQDLPVDSKGARP